MDQKQADLESIAEQAYELARYINNRVANAIKNNFLDGTPILENKAGDTFAITSNDYLKAVLPIAKLAIAHRGDTKITCYWE